MINIIEDYSWHPRILENWRPS